MEPYKWVEVRDPTNPLNRTRLEEQYIIKEQDPHGKQPGELGAKLDHGKSPVWQGLFDYFPRACRAVSDVSFFGAKKYAWKGWEAVPNGIKRYADAGARHILDESIEGPYAKDSGLLHKAHKAWNALAELELYLREQEHADRDPNLGQYSDSV